MYTGTMMNGLSIYVFVFLFIFEKCQTDSRSCGYPPSQWCRSLEIATECGFFKANFTFAVFPGLKVLKQCMELNVTRPDPSVPPVDVAVYYDSLCPGWRTFLTGQLFPTWTMLRDIMRLILVPYGNAKKLPDQKVFSCQHGKPEWQANMLEACILNVTGHSAFLIVHCVESSSDVINAAQPCVWLYALSVEWGTVESCMRGSLGHRLMHENMMKTLALGPQRTHVPWVTFNGVYTPEWEDKAMSSLFNLVCKLYRGIKPPTCAGSLKKLDQGFCNSFS
ncbi:hypothetical protein QTP70_032963 [Hemibagrus guttatus]|uniref:Gamma-interferon-inducible lysosomal thiol reductase n=1 Tax=Hemibagrus guttatus TaxID=175788 RepID=A0AAE0QVL2_9TELE|nr:hypothetical protein QTP70_032963 [Hemibagrus guttatus]